jgi:hypothetical protein
MSFERVAEQKIREAIEAGAFDNLPNAGARLDLEEYFAMPEDVRMAYSVLKSANCLPEEVMLFADIARLEAPMAAAHEPEAKARLANRLQDARLRLAMALERHRVSRRHAASSRKPSI